MCTALYFWLAIRLDSWEDEPVASCFGLVLFVLMDIYLIAHWAHDLISVT